MTAKAPSPGLPAPGPRLLGYAGVRSWARGRACPARLYAASALPSGLRLTLELLLPRSVTLPGQVAPTPDLPAARWQRLGVPRPASFAFFRTSWWITSPRRERDRAREASAGVVLGLELSFCVSSSPLGARAPCGGSMFPALKTELQQPLPDPYEDFMRRHLQYYGYFRGRRSLSPARVRSRQLLYDEPDSATPRLREPRELFPVLSGRGPLQAPRWPVECEVIRERVQHIEWVPPEPEYFYQSTGNEKVPEIMGEEKGTVVYQLQSVPTEGSYFTSSRVGGKRGSVQQLAVSLHGPEDDTLLFESRFESGNLQKAVKVAAYEYELTLRPDLYTDRHTQWFYFRVQNTRKDVRYRFTIVNLRKPRSLFAVGLRPLLYSQRDACSSRVGWRREGGDIRYFRGGTGSYCLTWTARFPHDRDTCFWAPGYPYTFSDLTRYLRAAARDPARARVCRLRALCCSLAGNPVYLLTVTNPARGPQAAAAKRAVVLSARVHPGESAGSWVMRGFLDFILGSSPDAQLLRDLFVFKVVPMLNPDGVIVGNHRCSLSGRDLNRHYRTLLKDAFPCIWYTRNMVQRLLEEREVLLYCDFHGHSRKNNVFLYGCSSNSRRHWLHERVFPLMLSKNAPEKFSFQSCNFKVQKNREGTGRVVMWRMGIRNSYTLESTFGGSTLGSRRDTHLTTEDLKALGHHICDTLLDFCDPDQTKFIQCLAELTELVHQEIHRKLSELGQDVNLEENWSDIHLSDIESSTSGSDSSLSDGLPAHLLHRAEEVSQKIKMFQKKKKKPLQTRKQRNEQYQNSNSKRFGRGLAGGPLEGRASFATTLQKQPAFLKQLENPGPAAVTQEKVRRQQTQLSGRGRDAAPAQPAPPLIRPKDKERVQQVQHLTAMPTVNAVVSAFRRLRQEDHCKFEASLGHIGQKPGAPASLAPRSLSSARGEPAPGAQPGRRRGGSLVAYPALHVCTYPCP
ncbi:cytosolic carboxypeptidase 2 isoform X4 [Heterocephalus glaber]|uniref:Cytosolic carboxypeptidase 2 n=1 Tax=Heterocephalus glaber TaxID=10181 RepID=A0AAX6TBS4_HETGA|nr:cytosolic carboxypeptidase 2 isoform X4 [Heterocephalus glaber]